MRVSSGCLRRYGRTRRQYSVWLDRVGRDLSCTGHAGVVLQKSMRGRGPIRRRFANGSSSYAAVQQRDLVHHESDASIAGSGRVFKATPRGQLIGTSIGPKIDSSP